MSPLPNLQVRKTILFGLASGTDFSKLPLWIAQEAAYVNAINAAGDTPIHIACKSGTLGKFPENIRKSHLMFESRRSGIPLIEAIKYCTDALSSEIINDNLNLKDAQGNSVMGRAIKYGIERIDWDKLLRYPLHVKSTFLAECAKNRKLDHVYAQATDAYGDKINDSRNLLTEQIICGPPNALPVMAVHSGLQYVPVETLASHLDDSNISAEMEKTWNSAAMPTLSSIGKHQYTGSIFWISAMNRTLKEIPKELITAERMSWKHPGCRQNIFEHANTDHRILDQFKEIDIPEALFKDIDPQWLTSYLDKRKLQEESQGTEMDIF